MTMQVSPSPFGLRLSTLAMVPFQYPTFQTRYVMGSAIGLRRKAAVLAVNVQLTVKVVSNAENSSMDKGKSSIYFWGKPIKVCATR